MPCSRFRPTTDWHAYFTRNAIAPRSIPWQEGVRWSVDDRRAVVRSVQEFQLGEQSEGRYLQRCADAYAAAHDDPAYSATMALFIREEQRHARELAQLLTAAVVPLKTRTGVDLVFRGLRKLRVRRSPSLENCLRVLVTAETVATQYYAALRDATACPVTQALCRQILRDEAAHLRFHAERLARFQRERSARYAAWVDRLHGALLAATCLAVWPGHRRVFRRAGVSYRAFAAGCQRTLDRRVLRVGWPCRAQAHSVSPLHAVSTSSDTLARAA
ncbi:MAG: ferritin-like domain-containing protein [Bacteroidota bacterium]